jgi:hypothetical protein
LANVQEAAMRCRIPGLLFAIVVIGPASVGAQPSEFGTVSVSFRPVSAAVYVDGERWFPSAPGGPLAVQVLPGRHTIDVRAPQHQSFSTVVEVRRGESVPLNVSLLAGPGAPPSRAESPPVDPSPPAPPGPIRQTSVTPSGDGFMIAPDFKITSVDHHTTGLAGVYGGAVFAGRLLLGAGGYWQVDSSYAGQLAYGGFVAEYRFLHDSPIGLNVNGLAGYGQLWGARPVPYGYYGYGYPYAYPYEGFFVGEPQLQVVARFGPDVRLVGGAGYRFTSADFRELDGLTVSFSIQFGR